MKCYLIYSECSVWLTKDFEDKDSGVSFKYESINEMVSEFRWEIKPLLPIDTNIYEECSDENGNTFFQLSNINNI